MNWYYEKNRQQFGPIEEDALKALFDSDEINSGNLVWCQGMKDWATYGSVFGTGDAQAGLSSVGNTASIPLRPKATGTGGQSSNSELRAQARQALSGSWGMAVLAVFLWQMINGAAGMVPFLGIFVQLAIAGAMMVGLYAFFTDVHRGSAADIGVLFQGFSQFGQTLGIYLLTSLLVLLPSFLAAVPGVVWIFVILDQNPYPGSEPAFWLALAVLIFPSFIISTWLCLRYALVYFIAREKPELGVRGTIKESVELMRGRKWKLYFLGLSFIGWHILGFMALLIGLLWSFTYMFAAFAAFYDDLKEEARTSL